MLAILIFNLTHCRFVINVELCNATFVMVQMYSRMEYNRFTMYSNLFPWKSVNDAWLLTFSAVSGNKGNPVKQVPQLWGTFNQIKSGASRPSHHPPLSVKSSIIYCLFKTKHSRCLVTVVYIIIYVICCNVIDSISCDVPPLTFRA